MRELRAFTLAGTLIGTIDPAVCEWLHRNGEQGSGFAVANGDGVAAAALAPDAYVRVWDGTRYAFAWYPLQLPRRQRGRSTDIDLVGPGLMHLWSRALVYPESSCRPVDTRWFGPMSLAYVPDVDWTAPVSFGRHDSFPFGTDRGDGMADRAAELVSYTTSQSLNALTMAHRIEFTLAEDTDVVIQAYGDDYYRTWLDAAPLRELSTSERPYNWRDVQTWTGRLCAGDHVLYFEPSNLDANVSGANPVYICWSIMPAAGDGAPQASHHAINVTHNATSGSWVASPDGRGGAIIDWDASISQLETALNDILGAGEVTVTGTPGAYVVTFDGPTTGYTPHFLQADASGLFGGTLSVSTASVGASAAYIAHSSPSTGLVLPPTASTKGLTDYEILEIIRDEEIARGNTPLQHITLDPAADALTDSAGNGLPARVIEVSLDNGTGWRVIEILMEAGALFDITPDLVQKLWGSGDSRGVTTGLTYVLNDGSTVAEAANDRSGLTNVLRALSETGWVGVADSLSIATHGRSGATIRLDSYDEDGIEQFTPVLLEDLAYPQVTAALEVPAEHAIVPYEHYTLGDVVNAPAWSTSGLAATDVRVLEIGGRFAGRSIVWSPRGIS